MKKYAAFAVLSLAAFALLTAPLFAEKKHAKRENSMTPEMRMEHDRIRSLPLAQQEQARKEFKAKYYGSKPAAKKTTVAQKPQGKANHNGKRRVKKG